MYISTFCSTSEIINVVVILTDKQDHPNFQCLIYFLTFYKSFWHLCWIRSAAQPVIYCSHAADSAPRAAHYFSCCWFLSFTIGVTSLLTDRAGHKILKLHLYPLQKLSRRDTNESRQNNENKNWILKELAEAPAAAWISGSGLMEEVKQKSLLRQKRVRLVTNQQLSSLISEFNWKAQLRHETGTDLRGQKSKSELKKTDRKRR